jgi:hypothetical protein
MAQERLSLSLLYLADDKEEEHPVGFKLHLPQSRSLNPAKMAREHTLLDYVQYACAETARKVSLQQGPTKTVIFSNEDLETERQRLIVDSARMSPPPAEASYIRLGRKVEARILDRLRREHYDAVLVEDILE